MNSYSFIISLELTSFIVVSALLKSPLVKKILILKYYVIEVKTWPLRTTWV